MVIATFGYLVAGGGSWTSENKVIGTLFTCPDNNAEITSMSAYFKCTVADHKCKLAIYDNGSNLVDETNEETQAIGNSWKTFTFGANPTLNNAAYYLEAFSENVGGDNQLARNNVAGFSEYAHNVAYPNFPNPAVFAASANLEYSIYCTYGISGSEMLDGHVFGVLSGRR